MLRVRLALLVQLDLVMMDESGGRRKDQLVGCRVEILVDGKVVITENERNLAHTIQEAEVVEPRLFSASPEPEPEPGAKDKKD